MRHGEPAPPAGHRTPPVANRHGQHGNADPPHHVYRREVGVQLARAEQRGGQHRAPAAQRRGASKRKRPSPAPDRDGSRAPRQPVSQQRAPPARRETRERHHEHDRRCPVERAQRNRQVGATLDSVGVGDRHERRGRDERPAPGSHDMSGSDHPGRHTHRRPTRPAAPGRHPGATSRAPSRLRTGAARQARTGVDRGSVRPPGARTERSRRDGDDELVDDRARAPGRRCRPRRTARRGRGQQRRSGIGAR